MKRCPQCGETKPLEDFVRNRSRSNGRGAYCRPCSTAKSNAWRMRDPVRAKELARAARQANPEPYRAKGRRYRERNVARMPSMHFKYHLKRAYGITVKDYEQRLLDQNGLCAICHGPQTVIDHRTGEPRRFAVDHDHSSGCVRGLLCIPCNRGLGYFSDDPAILLAAARYLEDHRRASS